jgi:plasmid stabilization system protein ParE
MAFDLIWSPTAKFDLKNISAFISEDSVLAAERFVRNLFQSVERLADFPESGRIVPEFNDPSIREVIRKPCRIVYRVDSRKRIVEIARVWHAARGMPDIQYDDLG